MASIAQAEEDAGTALASFGSRPGFGIAVPVDPFEIARSMGIDVYTASLENDLAGMLFNRDGTPTIYVNQFDALVRQRFTCAHECGHFYLRQLEGNIDELGFVDSRAALASQGVDPVEMYANRFAAALLMPAEYVRAWKSMGAASLASIFNVSLTAMSLRLGQV